MSEKERLTPRKRAFVRAILTEKDTRNAAKAARIAESTGYRWIKNEAIQAAILDAEGHALEAVARGLLRLAESAVDTLDGAMGEVLSPARSLRSMVHRERGKPTGREAL